MALSLASNGSSQPRTVSRGTYPFTSFVNKHHRSRYATRVYLRIALVANDALMSVLSFCSDFSPLVSFFSIKAGTSDLTEDNATVVIAEKIITHENYDRSIADYDIALIRVSRIPLLFFIRTLPPFSSKLVRF